jgi:tetratricopeptide (TPR) repeat protein
MNPDSSLQPSPRVHQSHREIRVFISSTFRDMQKERELLVKRVFPELRRICAQRLVTFTEVDLRWGITEEQAAEGKVLPLCLAEIALSRPFFIGLLGERYGWIPETIPQSTIEHEPWLQEHVTRRTSVTELEILHGVLNDPGSAGHAFFFLRDPAYVNKLPATDIENYRSEDEECRQKLQRLKERIRKSGLTVVEDYPDPEALAEAVAAQFRELIDRLYPENGTPDLLMEGSLSHEAFGRSKLLAYVERTAHTAVLDVYAMGEATSHGLVVTGESGSGKSALLASWCRSWRETCEEDVVFEHYFGATPESATISGFLRRLLGELKKRAGISDEIPGTSERMQAVLPDWLAQTNPSGKVVLVLDALNQVSGGESERRLNWLPVSLPAHVRIVASSLPGTAVDILRARGWEIHILSPADEAERIQMMDAFLAHYRKALPRRLGERIARSEGAGNPLFLRTVLEELRQFGNYEQLPRKIEEYLSVHSPVDLFRLVIRRWAEDFQSDRDLVARSLRCLWAAREGLSESEWLNLLADASGPMDRQAWRPFFFALEPHLTQHSGLHTFGHDYLRQAVAGELLEDEEDRQAAHRAVADYFAARPTDWRKAQELPWQLRDIGDRDSLRAHLLDIPLALLVRARDQNELLGHWVWLADERTMGQLYLGAFDRWSGRQGATPEVARAAGELAGFLHDAALFPESESLLRCALSIDERLYGVEHAVVGGDLNNLAAVLREGNRPADAEPLMRRALQINEARYGPGGAVVATNLSNLAILLKETNRLDESEQLLRRALTIAESINGPTHPEVARALNNLASVLEDVNHLEEAETLMRRALEIAELHYGPGHPDVGRDLNNLGMLFLHTHRLTEAEQLLSRSLDIHEACYGPHHPQVATSLNNLGLVLQDMNRLEEAEPLMRRALVILESSVGSDHPTVASQLSNLGTVLQATGRYDEAEALMRRALEIHQASYGPGNPAVATDLNNLGQLMKEAGRCAEAEPLMRRAVAIDEASYGPWHPEVARDLSNLSSLLQAAGDLDGAEPLIRRALAIDECSFGPDHPTVAKDLNNLGSLLWKSHRFDEAEPLMRRTLEILMRRLGPDHPWTRTAPENYAALLHAMGKNRDQILGTLRDIGYYYEEATPAEEMETARSLNNQALTLRDAGRLSEAESMLRESLRLDTKHRGSTHPKVAHRINNLCTVLLMEGSLEEAGELLSQAWEIKTGQHDITSMRILYLRCILAYLQSRPVGRLLGQLKTLLKIENLPEHAQVSPTWQIGSVLQSLSPQLPAGVPGFLMALVGAMNDRATLAELEEFPEWREAAEEPV